MKYILPSINYSKVMPKKMVSSRKYNAALHIDCFHSVKTTSTSFQPRSMFHFENRAIFELPSFHSAWHQNRKWTPYKALQRWVKCFFHWTVSNLFFLCRVRISRLRLNIIIVSVSDLLIFWFIDICRLDIHSFYNSTVLLPVLVSYKREIVILMKGVRSNMTD